MLFMAPMPLSTTAEPMAKPSKNWWSDSATSSVLKASPAVTPSVMPISTAGSGQAGWSGEQSAGGRERGLQQVTAAHNRRQRAAGGRRRRLTRVEDDAGLHEVDAHHLAGVLLVLDQRLAPVAVHLAGGCSAGGGGRVGAGRQACERKQGCCRGRGQHTQPCKQRTSVVAVALCLAMLDIGL